MRRVVVWGVPSGLVVMVSLALWAQESQSPASLPERVGALEEKVAEIERRLATVEIGAGRPGETTGEGRLAPESPTRRDVADPISVRLVSKTYHEMDLRAGDGGDRIDFVFEFTSRDEKTIRAFRGAVVFKDLLGTVIRQVGLTYEDGIVSGETKRYAGGIEYNQFRDPDRRLRAAEPANLRVEWITQQVLYADGAERFFPGE